ncbi:baseplate J/gp47 family protein [Megasphaera elsdenii]|uniref:baseplate J/gp47 family protein n=1 Tax=Megasphaera elsdenii TaxID=907 RepID=UPI0024324EF3|nr:baseplate J/gp47 family protein [Megasphaera elsdenii]
MADNNVYGLTRDGFRRKRLPEILSDINRRVSDRLGVEIETGSNSLFGQLHGVFAYEIADLWEQAENTYNATYPNTATGVSLSNAAGLAGISAISGTQSQLLATCYGTDGTVIPYGAQITSSAENGSHWECIATNAAISKNKACYAAYSINSTIQAGTVYTIKINEVTASYTAVSGDTASKVLSTLMKSFSDIPYSMDNGILSIRTTAKGETFATDAQNVTISSIGTPIKFRCVTVGAVNPDIGTINQIVTSIPGWTGVLNQYAASVGQDAETDTHLRQRWNRSLFSRGSTNIDAIAEALADNVTGVTTVKVYENRTDVTDTDGRPPHSIEAIVEGGENDDIAKVIWKTKAGGINTYGTEHGTTMDANGTEQTLYFNRPSPVKIWLKVVISENPDETLAPAAVQQIAEALLAKGQEQAVGEDVILQRYFSTIFKAASGVGYISLTAATGDTAGTYSTSNISITPRQIAVFDAARIEVTKQ